MSEQATRRGPDLPEHNDHVTRIGSLFSGSGMLDEAVRHVFGGEVAWFCEYEPLTEKISNQTQAAARVLAHHWPSVPNHGDVVSVNWDVVEPVDILTAGFPCVDVSAAGRRAGLRSGTRSGLWLHATRAIFQLHPKLVIIENVRGLLSADAACDLEPCPWCLGDNEGRPLRALGRLLGDLAELGFDARWCSLRASDVGAPHERFRVFIVAWPASADTEFVRRGAWRSTEPGETQIRGASGDTARRGCGAATNPEGDGRGEGWPESAWLVGGPDAAQRGNAAVADPSGSGRGSGSWLGRPAGPATIGGGSQVHSIRSWVSVDGTDYGLAIRRWELSLGRPAPDPTVAGRRGGQQLSPFFTEWMLGWPEGWVTDVPGLSRNDMIRICGNGVVPQQCVAALRHMLGGVLS